MPKRTNPFQQLIHKIHATCAGPKTTVTESFLEPDPDGIHREVDILIEEVVEIATLRTAIECRNHGRKASIEWIDQVVGKYEELEFDRVVLVNRMGFSAPAEAKAARHAIQLRTLTELSEEAWPDGLPFLWLTPYKERLSISITTGGFEGGIPIPGGCKMTVLWDGMPQLQESVTRECWKRREANAQKIRGLRNTLEKLRTGSVTMRFSMAPRHRLRLGVAFKEPISQEDIKWIEIAELHVLCRITAEVTIPEHKRYFYEQVGRAPSEPANVVVELSVDGRPFGTLVAKLPE